MNKQNFINIGNTVVKNSYDVYFTIGDVVKHQDKSAGEATIESFKIDIKNYSACSIHNVAYGSAFKRCASICLPHTSHSP